MHVETSASHSGGIESQGLRTRVTTAALPDGFCLPSLTLLAHAARAVAQVLTCADDADSATGRAWFDRVDRMIRSEAASDEIVELTNGVRLLRDQGDWNTFIQAVILDSRVAGHARRMQGRLRSLWGTTPIIGLINGRQVDRCLGVEAESLVFTTYKVTKDFDINLSNHVQTVRAAGVEEPFYWLVLVWAMLSFDVFFFYNDSGILPPMESTGRMYMGIRHEELALLRRAEKYLYTLAYGADYRTRERTMLGSRFNFCMDCPSIGAFCFCNSDAWPVAFHIIAAYATAMLSTGLARQHLAGSYRLDYIVVDVSHFDPCYIEMISGRKVRVLHVPNHPHFKGTRYLEQAIARFPTETSPQFMCKSGLSNAEVLDLMRASDLVVDQLIGGNFGQTALEAMALGKPVIAYIADWDLVLAPDECPIINANPDSIFEVLNGILADPGQLAAIGKRSRQYVEKYYSISALKERLRQMYKETAGLSLPLSELDRE
jgi:hypothetical protein